jgi:hypothetical protein
MRQNKGKRLAYPAAILLASLIFAGIILFSGCSKNETEKNGSGSMQDVTGANIAELEKTACNSADSANTCSTRLAELGFITKEECCDRFSKCCE